jgi:hypothetical protein
MNYENPNAYIGTLHIRETQPMKPPKLIVISGKTFNSSDEVALDGTHFENCHFMGCTITYRGGHFQLQNCEMDSPTYHFHDEAARTLGMLNTLCDDDPEMRNILVPNWKKWKSSTIQ